MNLISKNLYRLVIRQLIIVFVALILPIRANAAESGINTSYEFHKLSFNGSTVSYIETNKLKPKLVVADGFDSVKNLTDSTNGIIGINAGAWNTAGKTDFTFANGLWYSIDDTAYVGDSLIFTKDGRLFSSGYDYTTCDTLANYNPEWIVTGYNAVIYDTYCKNLDWNTKHDRSFIGQLNDGSYIAGTATNMTYEDMYKFAKSTWQDNIRILYNLDGGGSCNLYLKGCPNTSTRDVKSAICFCE